MFYLRDAILLGIGALFLMGGGVLALGLDRRRAVLPLEAAALALLALSAWWWRGALLVSGKSAALIGAGDYPAVPLLYLGAALAILLCGALWWRSRQDGPRHLRKLRWLGALFLALALAGGGLFFQFFVRDSLENLERQRGRVITSQSEASLVLTLPKLNYPETKMGETTDLKPLFLTSDGQTSLYLERIGLANESDEQLVATFLFDYELGWEGRILLPYEPLGEGISRIGGVNVGGARDGAATLPGVVSIRGFGAGARFAVYIDRAVYDGLEEGLTFTVTGLTALSYRAGYEATL